MKGVGNSFEVERTGGNEDDAETIEKFISIRYPFLLYVCVCCRIKPSSKLKSQKKFVSTEIKFFDAV